MFEQWPLLSLVIWIPIIAGFLLLTLDDKEGVNTRRLALIFSIITFLVSLALLTGFKTDTFEMQFTEKTLWINALEVYYHLGVDGISMPLIVLTSFITVLVVLAAWENINKKIGQYFAAFLIMEGLMNGVFSALDSVLFYVFWEGMLIPMFLIIGIWGGPRRIYATIKFFLYTFLGSVLMLVALLYLIMKTGSTSILDMYDNDLGMYPQLFIFGAFFLAFAVKIPMWPVHTWLPDAHVEAPTGGSVILAAIMLKVGGYGFLRFSLPITPDACAELSTLMIVLALIAIVYIGFVALVQEDMKKLIAYSSISHMGFVTLGIFLVYKLSSQTGDVDAAIIGIEGAMVQMISHGFISAAMFLCIGVMYDRIHSRKIADYGGVVNTMPKFAALMVFFAMANAGLPGTSGFVGEFMVIISSFHANFWIAFLAAMTLILGAGYTLWMVKRVIFGSIANDKVANLEDINLREFIILGTLAFVVLLMGLWPEPVVNLFHPTVEHLLTIISVESK